MAGNNGSVGTQTVGKLENFSGVPGNWSEWSFKARACFGLLDVGHGAIDMKMNETDKITEAVNCAERRHAGSEQSRLQRARAGLQWEGVEHHPPSPGG